MKNLKSTAIFLLALLLIFSCKKTEDKDNDYNVLRFNSGSDAGFVHVYSPNLGFWSFATETVKSVHLVFGDTDDQVINGKDIMSIYFYDEGTGPVTFPSAQGQHCNFSVTISGSEKYYSAEDAKLTISEFTSDRLKGSVSGTFISGGPEFETVTVSMDIDIQMVQI